MPPPIALFRAREDSERAAARLGERGLVAVIAPVVAPRRLAAALPPGAFDAVIATSARGVDSVDFRLPAPLYVVGERTARAAAARGFALAPPAAPNAAALAENLALRLQPGARALYLAGRDRKPDLEASLRRAGVVVETVETYAARARGRWTRAESAALRDCGAALHYSRRSAELAIRLAQRAGLADPFRNWRHVAISADAAAPLASIGVVVLQIAARPDEEAMLALI